MSESEMQPKKKRITKPLTYEDRLQIKQYLEKGFSISKISKEMGRNLSTINSEVTVNGGRYNYHAREVYRKSGRAAHQNEDYWMTTTEQKEKRITSKFNYEDRLKIKELLDKGCSMREIARIMGKPNSSILGQINNNGGKLAYYPRSDDEKGQRNLINRAPLTVDDLLPPFYDKIKPVEAKVDTILQLLQGKAPMAVQEVENTHLEKQVKTLTMQVELLFDLLTKKGVI